MMNYKLIGVSLLAMTLAFGCSSPKEATEEVKSEDLEVQPSIVMSKLEEEHQPFKAAYADSVNQGLIDEDKFTGSARRVAISSINGAEVSVNYGSPGKRGRVLWNGLVSYNQIWVSGSHWATAVNFSQAVKIDGQEIPAGTYGFFTIPGPEQWVLILNKQYDMHLAEEYTESDDLVRLTVTPETLDEVVQRLTYTVTATEGAAGELSLMWDQVKVSMPFEVI